MNEATALDYVRRAAEKALRAGATPEKLAAVLAEATKRG
jgi:hypothetical protein